MKDTDMMGSMVVGVDGTEDSDVALRQAQRLADRWSAKLTVVHAVPLPIDMMPDVPIATIGWRWPEISADLKTALRERVTTAGRDYPCDVSIQEGPAGPVIEDMVKTSGAQLVVLGAHRSSFWRRMLGSTVRYLVRHCPADVYVARRELDQSERPIVVAVALDGGHQELLRRAARIAGQEKRRLIVTHTVQNDPAWGNALVTNAIVTEATLLKVAAKARTILEKEIAEICPNLVDTLLVSVGNPVRDTLTAVEKARSDTLIVGTHGRSGLKRLWWGSVSERLATETPANVWIVRPYGSKKD